MFLLTFCLLCVTVCDAFVYLRTLKERTAQRLALSRAVERISNLEILATAQLQAYPLRASKGMPVASASLLACETCKAYDESAKRRPYTHKTLCDKCAQ